MIRRCYDPTHKYYVNYGGRGLKVCRRWRVSLIAIFQDTGVRPSYMKDGKRVYHWLVLRNSHRNYSPSNVKYIEPARNNRRKAFRSLRKRVTLPQC